MTEDGRGAAPHQRTDDVFHIVPDRAERRNLPNAEMFAALLGALERAEAGDDRP